MLIKCFENTLRYKVNLYFVQYYNNGLKTDELKTNMFINQKLSVSI